VSSVDETDDLTGRALIGDDIVDDREAELVALAPETDPEEGRSAEEAAIRITDDRAPG
jgi:hypothetical protein